VRESLTHNDDVQDIERRACNLHAHAVNAYSNGQFRRAAELAEQAVALHARPDYRRLLACAQLMSGDFPGAVRSYRDRPER
jgi:hypothetical protein